MAAPTRVESLHSAAGGSSTSVATGAGTAVDDVILIMIGDGAVNLAGSSAPTSSPSLTWNAITNGTDPRELSGNGGFMRAYWARVTSAGSVSITAPSVGGYNTLLAAHVVRGADTTNPIDAAGFSLTDPAANNPSSPSISPTTSDALLFCATVSGDAASATYNSQPSGMTDHGSDSQFGTMATASLALTASGATGSKTWSFGQNRRFVNFSVAIKGASASGTPQTGRASLGISGRGTGVKVVAQTGRCSAGLGVVAVARKLVAQTAATRSGLSGSAVAKKLVPQSSVASSGVAGTGANKKIARSVAISAAGLAGSAVANKKTAASGRAVAGLAAYGPTQGQRPQTGRASLGISGRATTVRIATILEARAVAGIAGTSAPKKSSAATGSASLGASIRATVAKRVAHTATASVGVANQGAPRHIAARNGLASVSFTGMGSSGGRKPIVGTLTFGVSGYGGIYRPQSVEHLAGATQLISQTGSVELLVATPAILLKDYGGSVGLQEASTTK